MSTKFNDPLYAELFNVAILSPELDRITANMRRHTKRNAYDPDKVFHSVRRYVVEPAAIELAAQKQQRWFKRYGPELLDSVARGIVRCEEREQGKGVG